MVNNIFDTHAHYDDEAFDEDRFSLLESLPSKGVSLVIECGCDHASSMRAIELAERFDFVYAAVGIHPENVEEVSEGDFERIEDLCSHPKVVAIGEIGLDFHWDMPKELQLEVFERQLALSKKLSLPVIVHDREAHECTLELLKKYKPKGVLHCFSGSVETAREVIELGMYIGLGGAVTFKGAKKPVAVAGMLPSERLLLETDCPYMAPVPFRGKRCDSSMIAETAAFIASVRGVEVQSLIDSCNENGKKLFGIK